MSLKPRLLLVSPSFHGYHDSIARALEEIGYEVVVHRYDAFDSAPAKIKNKVLHELPSKLGIDRHAHAKKVSTRRSIQVLRDVRPDRLVVIKGDTLATDFWVEVESMKIPRILWLYDDLKRHSYDQEFLRSIGPVASYSNAETDSLRDQGVEATYLPNGFDPQLSTPSTLRTSELVFVGSRYPNRVEIIEGLQRAGMPVRVYGRQWSHHLFDRLRTWELTRPDIPAERDIPLSQAYRVQAEALAAINIHGLQTGLSMRTFEVPGMGGVQLIDRPDVEEFYDIGTEVLLFRSPEELREHAQRILVDTAWTERIRQAGLRRSLAQHSFVHRMEILENMWA